MNKSCRTVYQYSTGELTIKKSRFIASLFPISTEEEALTLIDEVKKKHSSARHNCFAFVLGEMDEVKRQSDDGEPSKTAGLPILDLICSEGLHNILIVVTRYFGGTLLGTGGLVHAYQGAAKDAINNAVIIEKYIAWKSEIFIDYTLTGKLKYTIAQMGIFLLEEEYTDKVRLSLLIPEENFQAFQECLSELTAGSITLSMDDKLQYTKLNNKLITF